MTQIDEPPLFVIEDHLPWEEIDRILDGYVVRSIDRSMKPQAILAELEANGEIIVTASRWFFNELRRTESQDKGLYKRAGVVLLPGQWAESAPRIEYWLPLIDQVIKMKRNESDSRVVIELKATGVLTVDP